MNVITKKPNWNKLKESLILSFPYKFNKPKKTEKVLHNKNPSKGERKTCFQIRNECSIT